MMQLYYKYVHVLTIHMYNNIVPLVCMYMYVECIYVYIYYIICEKKTGN